MIHLSNFQFDPAWVVDDHHHWSNWQRFINIAVERTRQLVEDFGEAQKTVLDLGCGWAFLSLPIRSIGWKYVGIESRPMATARNICPTIQERQITWDSPLGGYDQAVDIVVADGMLQPDWELSDRPRGPANWPVTWIQENHLITIRRWVDFARCGVSVLFNRGPYMQNLIDLISEQWPAAIVRDNVLTISK